MVPRILCWTWFGVFKSVNYYISDSHFGHKNILSFDRRPYDTTEEMELDLIFRWNSQVSNEDHVYVLGDFLWKAESNEWIRILNKLKGNIHLILGNHDPKHFSTGVQKKLSEICHYKEVTETIDGKPYRVILSHFAILSYYGSCYDNCFHLHGHTHTTKEQDLVVDFAEMAKKKLEESNENEYLNRAQMINVGCMMPYMNYTPQTFEYLLMKYKKGETKA